MDFTFGKDYKLCSKKEIDRLFSEGRTAKQFPFLGKFLLTEFTDDVPFKIVISAPKRSFKLAVERNRIKRLSKEAIRLNKHILESWLVESNKQLALFLVFQSNKEEKFELVNKKIETLFKNIVTDLNAINNE